MGRQWRIAHFGCVHDSHDAKHGLLTRYKAMRFIEKFGANTAVDHGDGWGGQGFPTDEGGRDIVLHEKNGLDSIAPESVFGVTGNHDVDGEPGEACLSWFAKYRDPFCENTETSGRRKEYQRFKPVGTLAAYEVVIGNIVYLFLSDTNRPSTPRTEERGGDPGGVVSARQYQWWKDRCAHYRGTEYIVVTVSHYPPYNTTSGSGEYEGGKLDPVTGEYKGIYNQAGITNGRGSSFLCFIGDEYTGDTFGYPFVEHLARYPGDCDVWLHAHLHIPHGRRVGGKGHIETLFGCTFVNIGHLTRLHHGNLLNAAPKHSVAEWSDGSDHMALERIMHADWGKYRKGLWSVREIYLNGKRIQLL